MEVHHQCSCPMWPCDFSFRTLALAEVTRQGACDKCQVGEVARSGSWRGVRITIMYDGRRPNLICNL
jgi:hypothetical protein